MGGIRTGTLLQKGNKEAEDEQKIPKAVLSTICRLENKTYYVDDFSTKKQYDHLLPPANPELSAGQTPSRNIQKKPQYSTQQGQGGKVATAFLGQAVSTIKAQRQ
jgi:hypothetical protein